MARSVARTVHPRGARPDTGRPEPDTLPRIFTSAIPEHKPGRDCRACRPRKCNADECPGFVHHIYADNTSQCDVCKRRD